MKEKKKTTTKKKKKKNVCDVRVRVVRTLCTLKPPSFSFFHIKKCERLARSIGVVSGLLCCTTTGDSFHCDTSCCWNWRSCSCSCRRCVQKQRRKHTFRKLELAPGHLLTEPQDKLRFKEVS